MLPLRDDIKSPHEDFLKKIKDLKCFDKHLQDDIILRAVFKNFRTGAGLNLSQYGKELCIEFGLYEFYSVPITFTQSQSSLFITSLDRVCSSPYYIKGLECFISDLEIQTLLFMYAENFDFLFENFS